MRWVVVINAAGVLAGTAYTGYAISPSHAPLWAGIATFLYLIGLFVPLAAEYGSLDKGFREVGGSFVETRRREKGMGPAQEIFTDAPPAAGVPPGAPGADRRRPAHHRRHRPARLRHLGTVIQPAAGGEIGRHQQLLNGAADRLSSTRRASNLFFPNRTGFHRFDAL